jgi:hypothetical protein
LKDPDHLIKVEKAIQEKYGSEAVQDPKSTWSDEKEMDYLEQIKKIYKNEKTKEKIEVDGVLLPKKLLIKVSKRTCPVCEVYSFKARDDLYMAKFKCCFECYIQHVEGREQKWLKNQMS